MSRTAARARAGRDRTSLYQEITDKIIAVLEAGRVPWVQPWGTVAANASLAMPKNATTHRQYSGINVLILWGAVIEHGFRASIAHEVNQPLSGISSNASAALRWIRREKPDLARAVASLEQIIAASHGASDIITSLRAMFKKDTSEQSRVDINNLILTVLAGGATDNSISADNSSASIFVGRATGPARPPLLGSTPFLG
jgi:signal transduction histidine kinase